jgi:hypothetical protein
MEPQHIRFGGGAADTLIHPLVAIWMAIAIILILFLPRKYVIAPLLLVTFTVPLGQVVVLAGVHFTVIRILIVTGLVRWAASRRSSPGGVFTGGFNSIDGLTTLWALMALITFSLQWMDTQALIKSLGDSLDLLGGYLVIRFLIQDREDVRRTLKVFAAICVIMGVCMINEQITHQNIFGFLGGFPITPAERAGGIRAQGIFGVYIDAGVFGAILIPLFVWLWSGAKSRVAAALGMTGATAMTLASNSSTPQLAYVAGIVGLCFWPLRRRMRLIRWGFVIILVMLHFVMKAPVWALIARVDLTGSSSGFHRYMLVDNCIRHFSDWWLLGYKDYNNWGWDMWDLSNQFVAKALTGGLVTLVLFIWILSRSFGGLGSARKFVEGNRAEEWFLWCLGAALFANVVGFFGCSYMAQMQMALFPLLAIISVATFEARQAAVQTVEAPAREEFASAPGAVGAHLPLAEANQEARHGLSSRRRERLTSWLKA